MRNTVGLLSLVAAAAAACAVAFLACARPDGDPSAGALAVLGLVGAACAVSHWCTFLALNSLFVRVTRGQGYVRWVPLSDCRSVGAWLSHDWRFFSRGALQDGTRCLGFEFAYAGTL